VPDARLLDLLAYSAALWAGSRQVRAASRALCQRSRFLSRRFACQYEKSNDLLTRSRFHQEQPLARRLPAAPAALHLMA